jgi:hypothetical protein
LRLRCRLSSTGRDHIVEVPRAERIAGVMARLGRITGVSFPSYMLAVIRSRRRWRSMSTDTD